MGFQIYATMPLEPPQVIGYCERRNLPCWINSHDVNHLVTTTLSTLPFLYAVFICSLSLSPRGFSKWLQSKHMRPRTVAT
uniref:Uncharacterized protein n=1 Tax=Ralstonia syzygii R24 TaxID=907261 RepID=G3A8D1_9RALS|nr:hypothetical protein RALSY_mp10019 [Ralstonia syzygii R24]